MLCFAHKRFKRTLFISSKQNMLCFAHKRFKRTLFIGTKAQAAILTLRFYPIKYRFYPIKYRINTVFILLNTVFILLNTVFWTFHVFGSHHQTNVRRWRLANWTLKKSWIYIYRERESLHCFLVGVNKSCVIAIADLIVTLHSCFQPASLTPHPAPFDIYILEGAVHDCLTVNYDTAARHTKVQQFLSPLQ